MPKIAQYDAPTTKIVESNEGYSSWETAGRRIGPLLNQAAQDAAKEGALQAQTIKESAWPLRFLELAKKPTVINFKLAGGVDNKPWGDQNTTLGQVGVGAANIGDLMDEASGNLPDQESIRPNYGATTGGNLPPLDPWGTSGLSRSGGSPNAAAAAAAGTSAYPSPSPTASADAQSGGVVGRVGAAIAGVMGGSGGDVGTDGSAAPPGMF